MPCGCTWPSSGSRGAETTDQAAAAQGDRRWRAARGLSAAAGGPTASCGAGGSACTCGRRVVLLERVPGAAHRADAGARATPRPRWAPRAVRCNSARCWCSSGSSRRTMLRRRRCASSGTPAGGSARSCSRWGSIVARGTAAGARRAGRRRLPGAPSTRAGSRRAPAGCRAQTVRALGLVPFESSQRRRAARRRVRRAAAAARAERHAGNHRRADRRRSSWPTSDWERLADAYGTGERTPTPIVPSTTLRSIPDAARPRSRWPRPQGGAGRIQHARCDPFVWVRLEGSARREDLLVVARDARRRAPMAGGAYIALSGLAHAHRPARSRRGRPRQRQHRRLQVRARDDGRGRAARRSTPRCRAPSTSRRAGPARHPQRARSRRPAATSTSPSKARGFFEVETPQGVRYTRNGQFDRKADGTLITNDGLTGDGAERPDQARPRATITVDAGRHDSRWRHGRRQAEGRRLRRLRPDCAAKSTGASATSATGRPQAAAAARP